MKKHDRKTSKAKPSATHENPHGKPPKEPDMDQIANELDSCARERLPDGVLRGELAGYEPEIRQDAILLALSWHVRALRDAAYREKYPWIAARALAAALRLCKRGYLKQLARSPKPCHAPSLAEPFCLHPAMVRSCNWSASTIERVFLQAIRTALDREQITFVCALIAIEMCVSGTKASELADMMHIPRHTIYKHLRRTRQVISGILQDTEAQLMDPM